MINKLHIREMASASSGSSRFTNHVGAGWSEQCLAGAVLMTVVTSSAVTFLIVSRVAHEIDI